MKNGTRVVKQVSSGGTRHPTHATHGPPDECQASLSLYPRANKTCAHQSNQQTHHLKLAPTEIDPATPPVCLSRSDDWRIFFFDHFPLLLKKPHITTHSCTVIFSSICVLHITPLPLVPAILRMKIWKNFEEEQNGWEKRMEVGWKGQVYLSDESCTPPYQPSPPKPLPGHQFQQYQSAGGGDFWEPLCGLMEAFSIANFFPCTAMAQLSHV